jgi:hypothetical protein
MVCRGMKKYLSLKLGRMKKMDGYLTMFFLFKEGQREKKAHNNSTKQITSITLLYFNQFCKNFKTYLLVGKNM